ncbi:Holliday junction branch migration protein RuvA [methane-oxidizing endosymbiont of Gigantopelta aegis]|uniref:Holliday junction branch migration protein RuvA n=1 Tax=methane-oxidizing endosymbiont of Gigantopelta aegis TaxID=2794938 RepID=UPI0018DC94C2|nr:Holliday junction branch migration protein RuvA [methane-oxidizing endosymbiont of Gigantopelta aegis]
MIGFLRGKLLSKNPPQLLLDVHGVGYEIEAPMTTFYDLPMVGDEVALYTHLVVRDDAHILFGFSKESDRLMFRTLIKVNGVGPKLALTILSGQSAEEFRRCIEDNDTQSLIRLPGVGKKTAERLIVEMRDRLPALSENSETGIKINPGQSSGANPGNPRQEAITALCALGYKPADASKMVQGVTSEDKSCEDIIRLALQGTIKR